MIHFDGSISPCDTLEIWRHGLETVRSNILYINEEEAERGDKIGAGG